MATYVVQQHSKKVMEVEAKDASEAKKKAVEALGTSNGVTVGKK